MKIYLAGERGGERYQTIGLWNHVNRRLFSYFYDGFTNGNKPTERVERARDKDLFLDSGAFTAFTQEKTISPELYAQYVKDTAGYWTVCSSLDVIGHGEEAARASYETFQRLLDLGAKVIPVFHVREPDEWLQRYLEEGHEYLAIGGMVPERKAWLKDRLDGMWGHILTHADGTARIKVHGFGLTTFDLMLRYPWHSVDSTSWLMTGVYGACIIPTASGPRTVFFSPESPKARHLDGWHYASMGLVPDDPRKKVVDDVLAELGVTAEMVGSRYEYRDMINAISYQRMESLGTSTFHIQQPVLFE